jgi:hypothetical protein
VGTVTPKKLVAAASESIFGRPLVMNVYRSILTEALVAHALSDSWEWCSGDYASYDFIHTSGTRLEVKQTALRQSWTSAGGKARPSWDIKERTGYWEEGTRWIAQRGRNADIYVFALHDVADETADHRRSDQWKFYVVAASALPATQRLGLAAAELLTKPVPFDQLSARVERIRRQQRTTN